MSKTKNQSVTWHFLAGLLITEAGFSLLAFGELYLPGTWMHHLSYGGAFLVCLGMILLSWQPIDRYSIQLGCGRISASGNTRGFDRNAEKRHYL
jgi:hypothetical protein